MISEGVLIKTKESQLVNDNEHTLSQMNNQFLAISAYNQSEQDKETPAGKIEVGKNSAHTNQMGDGILAISNNFIENSESNSPITNATKFSYIN